MTQTDQNRLLWLILIAICLARLAGLAFYPLMDTSEARYAEVARKMVVLNDWITPMFDHGVPFWGKPPLSFWTQALSMKVLGISEFSSRFPAWLIHVAICAVIIKFCREERDLKTGLIASIIYSSCALGFVSSGVVLTDPALSFAIVLASYGLWRGVSHGDVTWARIGFIGLGLGMLAKGPLSIVLVGMLVTVWAASTRNWKRFLRLPWLSGLMLVAVVCVPWYYLAENKTPGFLNYFFVGEHWSRYVISKWQGDLYGSAHAQTLGTIWIYLIGSLFPWTLCLWTLHKARKRYSWNADFYIFLWGWALATPLFFTLAGNILWTYVLPALPAWAILLAESLSMYKRRTVVYVLAACLPVMGGTLVLHGSLGERAQNQRDIVALWKAHDADAPGELVYLARRSYSAEFYSAGRARRVENIEALPGDGRFYLSLRLSSISEGLLEALDCQAVGQANASLLLKCGRS
ncbi:Undecaprenyl phosphate-alpha-4-amino-4-deoxy-L-arabinose arabinosyl transferase [Pseudomonas fluorescens]|uniref:Undecaprenyl phosphate-alpha-4-amino-4-deoxy-L-arabinose arabinosyl transferase n=1 Tax=Pseudomonas fluorescens TaxID=294 RepID=A0A5E7R7I3_PSEFL|nr:glycosyltransferase family 39 protein [Pseudomonas fluorescens]VVP69420.1 Undecaprenyl phosphate-alpha-4-amino-4-deoxy-L-arabinose arabinosyl transferase [Pseudomonas fluorescens]